MLQALQSVRPFHTAERFSVAQGVASEQAEADFEDVQEARHAWQHFRQLRPRRAIDGLLRARPGVRLGSGWLVPTRDEVTLLGCLREDRHRANAPGVNEQLDGIECDQLHSRPDVLWV